MYRLFFFLILVAIAVLGIRYCMDNSAVAQDTDLYTLIPNDATYIIETEEPIARWRHFKDGKIWQVLQGNEYLADIAAQLDELDANLSQQEKALSYVLKGDMLVSAHVADNTYHYLYAIDIAQAAHLANIPPLLSTFLESAGYNVTRETYREQTIYHLLDPETNTTLFVTFKGNALIASYHLPLLKRAADTTLRPHFNTDTLLTALRQTAQKGMANVYINHAQLLELANCYAPTRQTPLAAVDDMLAMSGLDLAIENDFIELKGKSLINPMSQSYLKALLTVQKSDIRAHAILPANTSFFTSVCFDDFKKFRAALEQLQGKQPQPEAPDNVGDFIAQELSKALNKELPNWINHEIALGLVPKPADSTQQAYIAVLPLGDKRDMVAEKLAKTLYIIDQLNPLQFLKNEGKRTYRDYRIIQLPVQGLLRSAGGDLFKDMGKPYMSLINDFLVFCDDETTLRYIIDQYEEGNTLIASPEYVQFFARFRPQASVFGYIQSRDFYPVLLSKLQPAKRESLIKNKDYWLLFPHWGFQMLPDGTQYQTHLLTDFDAKQ